MLQVKLLVANIAISLRHPLLLCMLLLCSHLASSQSRPPALHDYLLSREHPLPVPDSRLAAVQQFYKLMNFSFAWTDSLHRSNSIVLADLLQQSEKQGLDPGDYGVMDIIQFFSRTNPGTLTDSLLMDVRITDAALHYFQDIAYGNTRPAFGYDGLAYAPFCMDVPQILVDRIRENQFSSLLDTLQPSLPETRAIEKKLTVLLARIADKNFREIHISSANVDSSNRSLVGKLYQLGILQCDSGAIDKYMLREAVTEAQRQFELLADGVLRSTILQELNVPLAARLQQLKLSINYYRWLYCLAKKQPVIVVNIPAAYLKVYSDSNTVLAMRMVLGKKTTPTPTLSGSIANVVLYPYWHVPFSIATKELLPQIRRNPGFIDEGNFQVLDRTGKIMDPYKINWQALSARNFPYLIRQSTGCDNALGLIKLDFESPFGVYLHDTPSKNAFLLNKRFFSHGCLRMEKPMELGHLVLKNHPLAIDTLEQKGCLRNQAPVIIPADERLPVIIWYNPAGVDTSGRVLFYEDVYNKFAKNLKQAN